MAENLSAVLHRKSAQISASAELAAAAISDWQIIQDHLTQRIRDIVLTEAQEKKLQRYQFIYNQSVSGKYNEREVCEMVKGLEGVASIAQALAEMRDAKELFTTAYKLDKHFELKMSLEMNLTMMARAKAKGDERAYAQLEKNRAKLISMIPDDEKALGEEFLPHTNNIMFNPVLIGGTVIPEDELTKLEQDLKTQHGGNPTIETIPFEEVKDGE